MDVSSLLLTQIHRSLKERVRLPGRLPLSQQGLPLFFFFNWPAGPVGSIFHWSARFLTGPSIFNFFLKTNSSLYFCIPTARFPIVAISKFNINCNVNLTALEAILYLCVPRYCVRKGAY